VIFISSNEIFRKIYHLFSSAIPLGYLWLIHDKDIMLFLLLGLSILALTLEFARTRSDKIKIIFKNFFDFMLRSNESEGSITGATWLLFGSTLTVFLFPIHIAVPALLFLTVGDSIAALVGQAFPFGKIGVKSLTGTFSGIIISTIVAISVNQVLPFELIFFGATISMIIEVLPIPLNDNVTIPVTGGLAMSYGMII